MTTHGDHQLADIGKRISTNMTLTIYNMKKQEHEQGNENGIHIVDKMRSWSRLRCMAVIRETWTLKKPDEKQLCSR